MRCEEVLEAVNEYLDEETRFALCGALQEHLAGCETCRVVIDNIRQTITLYRAGKTAPFPPALHKTLLAIMRQRWNELHPVPASVRQ
jgi:predicted anti-sigma-YlaC factor YlaD